LLIEHQDQVGLLLARITTQFAFIAAFEASEPEVSECCYAKGFCLVRIQRNDFAGLLLLRKF